MTVLVRYSTTLLLGAFLAGCAHSGATGKLSAEQLRAEQEQARQQARDQEASHAEEDLEKAAILIDHDRLQEAGELLAPLLASEEFAAKAQRMQDRINHLKRKQLLEASQRIGESRALLEVEQALGLPETYGQTVVISAESGPIDLPPGPMEQLIRQKVSMRLDNADVKGIVMALSKIDGLNLIADQALNSPATLTLHVDKVPLAEIFAYVARNMGIAFHVSENVVWVTAADPKAAKGPRLETRIFKLHRGLIPHLENSGGLGVGGDQGLQKSIPKAEVDEELEMALKSFLDDSPPGATYRLFPKRNLLIVRNSREKLLLVRDFLDSLDSTPLQVLIESRFVTLSQKDFFQLGFNLQNLILPKSGSDISFNDLQNRAVQDLTLEKNETLARDSTTYSSGEGLSQRRLELSGNLPGTVTLSGILNSVVYQAVLSAIRQADSSRTLSAPRITVTNNQSAYIFRGTKRFYFENYDLETVDQGDFGSTTKVVPTGSPKELPLGLFLSVRPNIGNDGKTLVLALKPEVKEFLGFESFSEDGLVKLPIVSESSLATTVVLNSGETVVLGGMLTKNDSETVKKVPVLGDIPLLGFFFRHRETTSNPEHLLIFVTARIIGPAGRYVQVVPQAPEAN